MTDRRIIGALLAAVSLCLLKTSPTRAQPSAASASNDFFERRVRPILIEHCHACHGAKKQEMGLRLDTAEGLRRGSDSGPVVTPGDPNASLLIQAVRHAGDVKMPPKEKLPETAIQSLAAWVQAGAAWPSDAVDAHPRRISPAEAVKSHWAFQPVRNAQAPRVKDARWAATSLDAFILARLESAGLGPNLSAERRTLIRRATFDLHGLPPTPDEVAAFDADSSPGAFAKVVDRLLASPRYGERWGRHWLDVARFADTKGYVRLNENPRYPSSWTYRDYVIRALNEDLPYDEFLRQQLAADQLPSKDDSRSLAALGFLTLGPRFINSQHDIIDDRIDVVTRGLLGLTVACARCHDHKFDPIPTRDYYGLHGVFASSIEPRLPPLIVEPSERGNYAPYLAELQQRMEKLEEFLRAEHAALMKGFLSRAGEYLLAAQSEPVQSNFLAVMFLIDASKDLNPVMTQRWARLLAQTRKQHHPVIAPWHDLAQHSASPGEEFVARIHELHEKWQTARDGDERVNSVVVGALREQSPKSPAEAASVFGALLQQAEQRWRQALADDPHAKQLADADWEEIRQLIYGHDGPLSIGLEDVDEFLFVDTTRQQQLHQRQRQVEDWIGSAAAAPHAMALVDAPAPADSRVFVRGDPSRPGDAAPRQFLAALSRGERRPFAQGSGRLELAEAIASPENPLTARVIVNRVWMHQFGAGLVSTPSDFGLRGEPPTHPELLDHLAFQFMANDWSLKWLHRTIMLSNTYQQSSDMNQDSPAVDPENRLLKRMAIRRLDWEALRDSLLAVSGQLDLTMSGPSVDLFQSPFSSRRSVYGLVDRQSLPSALRAFDFAPPDASHPQRHQTTTPSQALFLMNSPFLKQAAQHLTARPELQDNARLEDRVNTLHCLLFGRPVRPDEMALATEHLQGTTDRPFLTPWEEFAQALLLSNEFMFVE